MGAQIPSKKAIVTRGTGGLDGQPFPSFAAAVPQHIAAVPGAHAPAESVLRHPLAVRFIPQRFFHKGWIITHEPRESSGQKAVAIKNGACYNAPSGRLILVPVDNLFISFSFCIT